ncbi:MAG: S8/S53 family peptidase [Verrucomicrobia bacterium]|nr:S8/S53 family peptidase [Verrucomicrobiota bacterium]MBV8485609.1 S8/S53 family peptidase [Verrucomicrobiota bacterium]
MRVFVPGFSIALATGLCTCSLLTNSVSFNQRLMVKVRSNLRPDEMLPAAKLSSKDAWHFRHVVEAPQDPADRGDWYVAWRTKDLEEKNALTLSQLLSRRWQWARSAAPSLADATYRAFGVYPLMIEPNLIFHGNPAQHEHDNPLSVHYETRAAQAGNSAYQPSSFIPEHRTRVSTSQGTPVLVEVDGQPSAVWPIPTNGSDTTNSKQRAYEPFWYQTDSYSQLATARERVISGKKKELHVRVGILDTGLDDRQVATPLFVDESRKADADGWVHGWPRNQLWAPGQAEEMSKTANPSHGMATIGLLAGRKIILKTQDASNQSRTSSPTWLGGVPLARVVPVRVSSDPISLGTAAVAYGIDYASRIEHCDVISMSNGGTPTQTWVDAVNAAYDRGTAIFAAEGDFLSFLPYGWRPDGLIVPASPVYPAAFRRVIGVTGVTSEFKSYSGNSLARLFQHLNLISTWGFRGSYGPDGWLAGLNPRVNVDEVEAKWGALRPYPIAAYSPNVPWLSTPASANNAKDKVALTGSGTSAATPQVAAAAALWLEYHQKEFSPAEWNSWCKAEAVYDALLISAKRDHGDKPDLYFGAGLLKAQDAMNRNYASVQTLQSKALRFGRMAPDEFSGNDSFWRLLFRAPANVPDQVRAQLDQSDLPKNAPREEALARIYYNMLLLQKWHGGSIPKKSAEAGLRAKAWQLAKAAKPAL